LAGQFSTANVTAAEAIELIRAEWTKLAEEGLTQEELSRVQTYLTGAYPLRFDGNESIASILASMQFQGFDIEYLNIRNSLIDAVTLEEANAAAARIWAPDQLHFVVVGNPEGLVTSAQ
jgi:zinc protease